MVKSLKRAWPVLKPLLGLVVVGIVGYHLTLDLLDPRLWDRPIRPARVILSAALYVCGLYFSALTWLLLLRRHGQHARHWTAVRAYYLGHLAKYLPGRAWALFYRADLARVDGVRYAVSVLTSFYEVFLTMSSGALVGVILIALTAPESDHPQTGAAFHDILRLRVPAGESIGRGAGVLLGLVLLAAVGLPALPPVFNRLARRAAMPFADAGPLPSLGWGDLGKGMALVWPAWLLQGASLAAILCAVADAELRWTPGAAARVVGIMGLSYVAGFVIVFTPSGLGVREYFLALFLAPELRELGVAPDEARGVAVLSALLLRIAWTVAELSVAAAVWRLAPAPVRGNARAETGASQ